MATVFSLRRSRLPQTGWSFPFALLLVVVSAEVLVLVYLRTVGLPAVEGDFVAFQRFVALWTAGGTLDAGLSFELMKVNLLLVVYLWVMSRTMSGREEAVHRLALIAGALVVLALQVALAMSSEMARERFVLVPVG